MIFSGCQGLLPRQPAVDYNNTVTMLNVGQAASTLIESDGQFCLIDAGKYGGDTDIVSYLSHRKVKKIDLLVLTHFHYDHTSQALDVIRNFDIGTVLVPKLTEQNIPDTYFYKSIIEDSKNGYYSLVYAENGLEFTLGQGILKVLGDTPDTDNINNTSIATSFTINNAVYINTADCESDKEQELLEYLPENISFFTAGHHGSADATSQRLLDKLNPAVVGISCKENNEYGHPHSRMLKRLTEMGIPYYVTYETGNIVYSMDTQTIITE